MYKKILTMFLISMCTGCMSILNHTGTPTSTYEATKYVWTDCVGIWWNDYLHRHDPIGSAYIELTWLIWIVDFPFEVAYDTVWFPVDIFNTKIP